MLDQRVLVGIYALSALPTTISSYTVFTQRSSGNVAGTLFNASLFAYLAVSNPVLVLLAWTGARLLRFDRPGVVSSVYTAPQKTIALGIPLITTFFSSNPQVLGFAILPILFYHPWQLLIAGVVSGLRFMRGSH